MKHTISLLVLALFAGQLPSAAAQQCNTTTLSLTAESDDITMAVGEAAGTLCFITQSGYECSDPIPSGVLGACHRVSGSLSNVFTKLNGCTDATPSSNRAVIHLGQGDDFFRVTDREFMCAQSSSFPFPSDHILPWRTDFSFGLQVSGRGGSDVIAGSPRSDFLMSTMYNASTNKSLDDGADDLLCGRDGNDALYGDDGSADVERMHGGAGSDICDGFNTILNDIAASCETINRATQGLVNTAACNASVADLLE